MEKLKFIQDGIIYLNFARHKPSNFTDISPDNLRLAVVSYEDTYELFDILWTLDNARVFEDFCSRNYTFGTIPIVEYYKPN